MVILESGARAQPPVTIEFYFGTDLPTTAGPGAILDGGLGYSHNDNLGLDYGWDCDGSTDVDYSGGRRGLDRDNGLGINRESIIPDRSHTRWTQTMQVVICSEWRSCRC